MLPVVAKCDKIVYLYISVEEYFPFIRHVRTKPQHIRAFHCKYFLFLREESEANSIILRLLKKVNYE